MEVLDKILKLKLFDLSKKTLQSTNTLATRKTEIRFSTIWHFFGKFLEKLWQIFCSYMAQGRKNIFFGGGGDFEWCPTTPKKNKISKFDKKI